MSHEFSRTELILGREAIEKLSRSKVSIVGIGGVGSFAAEGLARSGVGKFVLIDHDIISISNINRQIHSDSETIGKLKTETMADRIQKINPKAEIVYHNVFLASGLEKEYIPDDCDYIIDAIDSVSSKISLVVFAKTAGIPIISSMGTGNKLDPTLFEITDVYKTSVCPLAKVMRKELRKAGIDSLKVLCSREEPRKTRETIPPSEKRQVPGSVSFVPSVAGLIIAGEVVKDIVSGS